jgi:hypothetical protein
MAFPLGPTFIAASARVCPEKHHGELAQVAEQIMKSEF